MRKTWPTPRHVEPLKDYKRHHYLNDIWIVRSPKMNRRMELDSDLEYLNWIETEGTPEVVSLCEHPVRAEAKLDGKDHTSVIDMYKLYNDGAEEYNEVKYENDIMTEQNQLQISVQVSYSNRVNVKHRVITEHHLKAQDIKIRNWKKIIAILNLGRELNIEKEMNIVIKTLNDRGQMPLADLIILLDVEEWIIELAVCRLLQDGAVDANLNNEDFCYTTMLKA